MKRYEVILLFSLLLCLLIVPYSFAEDNGTDMTDDNNVTDYYFDIDAVIDGDGQKDTPYNNFTDERVKDNSKIHLASGEYVFEKSRGFTNISFYGENTQTTILNGNGTTLTSNGVLNFRNLTLTNFYIVNNANLNAKDTIFTQLISTIANQDNDFGGAIYAPSNRNLYLDNCTFSDNVAEYGGAIYVNGGNLTVINSLFYNITAYNFGGAIVGQSGVRVAINNTRFLNVKSDKDAGGAIYLVSSSLVASNLTVVNASATFGSAVTALRSTLNLTDSRFENNSAKFEGGAIYQFYGSLYINSSEFIKNSARSGGAIFIDDVNVFNITNSDFINNTASNYAGAIYYLLNNDINLTGNRFTNNSATSFDDIYNISTVNLEIGNGNYTLYILNQTTNSTLPVKYDLRDYGFVTPVKDQKDGGNCWAFASIAALESCILKASGEVLDLSEENMKNLMAFYSDYGRNIRAPNDGGDNDMPIAYLVSWLGPVNESDDEYDDLSSLSPVLDSLMHVQNVIYFKRNNFSDNDAIKEAILKYGAVATTMRYDASSIFLYTADKIAFHYYKGDESTNHAVAIVGWDDNLTLAGKTGAWLVKNSWGPNWANNGYFYVSYYDTAFARPGNYASYTFILNDTMHFDKNYQYDISGPTDYFYHIYNQVWYENAYWATDNEFLSAVSTYFEKNTQWEINVYVNSMLQLVQKGTAVPGYFTINLDYPIPLVKGDLFEIIFKIVVNGHAGFPISEAMSLTKYTYYPNSSFVSYDFGNKWYDLYDLVHYYPSIINFNHHYNSQVACIKGFTQFFTLNSTIEDLNVTYDSSDIFNITVKLVDENNNAVRNGNVTFTVNDVDYNVSVYNGIALLQIPFVLGLNNISCVFSSPNYHSSNASTTFNVLPIPIGMNITVLQDFNNALINFTFSQLINNETLIVNINGDVRELKTINGSVCLNLTDLDYGNYDVSANLFKDVYDCQNVTSFFVNVKRTCLTFNDLTTFYDSGDVLNITLRDEFGQAISNAQLRILLNNETIYETTGDDGIFVLPVSLDVGVYDLVVFFDGDALHVKSDNSSIINITPSKTRIRLNNITYDSFNLFRINVTVFDQLDRILDLGDLTVTVDGVTYHDLVVPFVVGKNNVSINFDAPNYCSSSLNASYDVVPVELAIMIDVVQDFNNAYVTFNLSQKVNETIMIDINGVNSSAKSVNGSHALNLTGLDYGNYVINVLIDSDFYEGVNSTGFFVNVKRTYLEVENLTTIYNSGEYFTVKLKDQFNQPVVNRNVRFALNNNTYINATDEDGVAVLSINLKDSIYTISVSFEGDESYIKSQNSSRIVVYSSVELPANSVYALNSNYEVYLLGRSGNPLANSRVTFTINNVNYYEVSDAKGKATLLVPIRTGNVIVNVLNPETGEVKSQNIQIMPRITGNTNIVMYYGADKYFKVRAYSDYGAVAGAGETVSFKLNGITYNIKTDKNGYASLNINSKPGKYTITATYKGFSVSNKITVKTTLITKNKSVKKGKVLKFTAKLLNKNGKLLKKKKITFKIKGKTYKAKTNKKGIATIKIKNLKVGKYTITTKYGKLKNKNKITVKR